MTFEEFFNKKRIDLAALKAGEPGLFAEFELAAEEQPMIAAVNKTSVKNQT